MPPTVEISRLDYGAVNVAEGTAGPPWSTLYWYDDGRLISAGQFPRERVFSLFPGESRVIEILDDTSAPGDAYSGQVYLQWHESAGATKYKVQQWTGSAWADKRIIVSQGEEVFTHLTEWLSDASECRFRVLPINEENIDGTPLEFTFTVVCRPDAPDTTAVYDENTQRVTVTVNA